MKRLFIAALFLILTLPAAGQLKIDLKTPLKNKDQLKLAKAGLGAYLRQAEWARVVNVGEDYSVWITDIKRKFKGNLMQFEVTMELRTRADVGTGNLVASRTVKDTMDLSSIVSTTTFEEREVITLVEQQIEKNKKYKPIPIVLGTVANVPLAGAVIEKGLKFLGVDLEAHVTQDQSVEAMVLGAVLIANLKEMIDALPPKKP